MSIKSENTPSKSTILPGEEIILETRFGGLSQGKCWGKFFSGKSRATGEFEWVEKKNGNLVLTGPGYYVVGSDDGFARKARGEFELTNETRSPKEILVARLERILALGDMDKITVSAEAVGDIAKGQGTTRGAIVAEIQKVLAGMDAPYNNDSH